MGKVLSAGWHEIADVSIRQIRMGRNESLRIRERRERGGMLHKALLEGNSSSGEIWADSQETQTRRLTSMTAARGAAA